MKNKPGNSVTRVTASPEAPIFERNRVSAQLAQMTAMTPIGTKSAQTRTPKIATEASSTALASPRNGSPSATDSRCDSAPRGRAGTSKARSPDAAESMVAEVIARTGRRLRVRVPGGSPDAGPDDKPARLAAVGVRLVVTAGFETVAADVIGRPSSDVIELELLGDIERVKRVALRGSPVRSAA